MEPKPGFTPVGVVAIGEVCSGLAVGAGVAEPSSMHSWMIVKDCLEMLNSFVTPGRAPPSAIDNVLETIASIDAPEALRFTRTENAAAESGTAAKNKNRNRLDTYASDRDRSHRSRSKQLRWR